MTSVHVGTLDVLIILLSLAAVLAIAVYYARFSRKSSENYFLGGREMRGWANGISYAATAMNSDVPPAYCGMMAATGLYLAWWYFSRFGLALMIGAVLFAAFWYRLRLFTTPEFYSLRFGAGGIGSAVRVWTASRGAFIGAVAWTGTGILGIHKIAGQLFGWKLPTTILVVVPFVFFYVYISGYKGVVTTDIVQSLIMITANIFLAAAVLHYFGGPVALGRKLAATFGSGVVSILPPLHDPKLGFVAILAWMLGASIGYGGDTASMGGAVEGQRILSCRSEKDAAWMYLTTEISLFLLLVLLTLPALGGILLWPDLHLQAYAPGHDPEMIYGRMLGMFLGPGFLGFVLAGLIASVMSTMSGNLNVGGQVVASDLYRHMINPRASEKQLLRVGRGVMAVIMLLAILVAWKARSIITIVIFMLGLSSAELSANWAQWWWWRFNKYGRLAATFGGPPMFILSLVFWKFVLRVESTFTLGYLATLSGMALTTLLWFIVALATPPDDMETLKAFFRRARPLGFWGPVRRECAEVPPCGRLMIARGLAISAVGFIAVSALILGISDFYVGKFLEGTILILVSASGGAGFFLLFNRYFRRIRSGLEISQEKSR